MSESVLQMRGRTREAGVQAIEVARRACAEISKCDADTARVVEGGALDGKPEVARRRGLLASGLSALADAHLALRSEDSDGLHRLATLTRSLSQEVSGHDPGGHITDAATLAGTIEVTASAQTQRL
jgi:hypothetical protein